MQGATAGSIRKRGGLVTLATPPAIAQSVFALESLGTPYLIATGATSMWTVTGGGTVTSIATGLTSGLRWEFLSGPVVSGQGPLYGMNGTDTPRQWAGGASAGNWTATDAGGAVPNGKYCLYANNQAFVAGVSGFPSRVYWSAIADPTGWNPANLNGAGFMDLDPNDGQVITALGRVGPYLLVCKPRKLYILVDTATATVRRLSDNVGCVAHRSIASGPEGTYFLAEDRGVYVTNGTKLTPISDKIQPTLDAIQPAQRANASGTYFAAHYYLSVPVSGLRNDTTLDYDATLQSWWKHAFGENQWAVWHPGGYAQLYGAKGTAAIVEQCFAPGVTTDNGGAMSWAWRGPWQSPTFYRRRRFPTPYFRKRLRQIRIDGTGTVDVSLAKDFADPASLVQANVFAPPSTGVFAGGGLFGGLDGSVWGGVPAISRKKLFSPGVANAFSLVFSATSTTNDEVLSYVLMLTDRRDQIAS